jgi:hypothetical protein
VGEEFDSGMDNLRHIPVEDLILDHELRVASEKNYTAFKCPCINCEGGIRKPIAIIRQHLCTVPQDPYLYHSMVGEDPPNGFPVQGIWIRGPGIGRDTSATPTHPGWDQTDLDPPMNKFLDLEHDIQQQVFDSLQRADELLEESMLNTETTKEFEVEVSSMIELEKLYREAFVPI